MLLASAGIFMLARSLVPLRYSVFFLWQVQHFLSGVILCLDFSYWSGRQGESCRWMLRRVRIALQGTYFIFKQDAWGTWTNPECSGWCGVLRFLSASTQMTHPKYKDLTSFNCSPELDIADLPELKIQPFWNSSTLIIKSWAWSSGVFCPPIYVCC